MSSTTATLASGGRAFFGHPRGLATLFSTELWERFSYYGMRAVLLYYMYDRTVQGGLGIPRATAAALISMYGALVYMSGILGGWIADRLIGSRRSVFYGGVLIMFGHIVLALPAGIGALYASMALIVLGTGMLKPNVSSMVGALYGPKDTRRDAGFSLFYMGINIGAFVAPYVVGTLGQKVSFHAGFAAAAVGMAIGLIQYVRGGRNLGDAGLHAANPLPRRERFVVLGGVAGGLAVLGAVFWALFATGHFTTRLFIDLVTAVAVLLPVVYFVVILRSPKVTDVERTRLRAYAWLFVASVFFWVIDEQGGSVLAQFADQRTQLGLHGFAIPSSWFASLNPVATIILAPTFAAIWVRLGDRQPWTPVKFSAGLVLAGLSFILMAAPGLLWGTAVPASPLWLVLSYFVLISGSMCLSPVGLSATTKLAPAAFAAQLMSLWLMSDAAAQGINAQLVGYYSARTEVAYFLAVGGAVALVGIAFRAVAPRIHAAMLGVN